MNRRALLAGVGCGLSAAVAGCTSGHLLGSTDPDDAFAPADPAQFPRVDHDDAVLLIEAFDAEHVSTYEAEMREVGFALEVRDRLADDARSLGADAFDVADLSAVLHVRTERPEGARTRGHAVRGIADVDATVDRIESNMDGETTAHDEPGETFLTSTDSEAVGVRNGTIAYGHDAAVVESILRAPTDPDHRYVAGDGRPAVLFDGLEEYAGGALFDRDEQLRIDGYEVQDNERAAVTARYRFDEADQFETQADELIEQAEEADGVRDLETTRHGDEHVLVIDGTLVFEEAESG